MAEVQPFLLRKVQRNIGIPRKKLIKIHFFPNCRVYVKKKAHWMWSRGSSFWRSFCLLKNNILAFNTRLFQCWQSLMIFFKCFKENGPVYVANLFKPRVTPYNLRSNGLNVVQTSYNSRFLHGSNAYMISHIWKQLPSAVKNAPNASSFRRLLQSNQVKRSRR